MSKAPRRALLLFLLQSLRPTPAGGFRWHASVRRPRQASLKFESFASSLLSSGRKRPFPLCGTLGDGREEESMAEMVEISEGEAKRKWVERGGDLEAFSVGAFAALLELEQEEDFAEDFDDAALDKLMAEAPSLAEQIASGAISGGVPAGGSDDRVVSSEFEDHFAGALDGGRAVGIDLGTTNSAIALIEAGKPVIVPNARGARTTPSVVAYRPVSAIPAAVQDEARLPGCYAGEAAGAAAGLRVLVGEAAQKERDEDATSTFASVKRVIGRTVGQARAAGVKLGALGVDQSMEVIRLRCPARGAAAEAAAAAAMFARTDAVLSRQPSAPLPLLQPQHVVPEEVSSEVLRALVADAERHLNGSQRVRRAVVAVPAHFDAAQCAATAAAGRLAGLDKVKIMREPEAAALAYGANLGDADELVLVFDLGGGTFDVSVVAVGGGVVEVVATAGDAALGGDDFDGAIADWLADETVRNGQMDPRGDPKDTRALLEAARAARVRLSAAKEAFVSAPLRDGALEVRLTRAHMDSLCAEPLRRMLPPLRQVAIMADVSLPGETGAFMAPPPSFSSSAGARGSSGSGSGGGGGGGGGRAGAVSSLDIDVADLSRLRREQSRKGRQARERRHATKRQSDAFSAVARSVVSGERLRAFPQGRQLDRVILVGGATRMPCVLRLIRGVTGVEPQRTVNPDEAVALGAAVFAGIMEGEVGGMDVLTTWQAAVLRSMARAGKIK